MKQTDRCHPVEVRPFSYRENARIQTFPDNWVFEGNLSSKYRQIGNAVPISLGYAIGKQIVKLINKEKIELPPKTPPKKVDKKKKK